MAPISTSPQHMLRRTRKNSWRRIVGNIVVGLVVSGVVFAAALWVRQAIEVRVASAKERLLLQKAVEERQSLFVTLSNDYKRLRPILPAVYAIVPPAEQVVLFDDAMATAAQSTGNRAVFQFDTAEPTADQKFPGIARVGFSATLEGSGETFHAFLVRTLSLRFLHTIDSVSIDGAEGIYGASTMRIRGTVFIMNRL